MMEKIFIVGATSAIAYETAKQFAAQGASLALAARNPEKLAAVAEDLLVRGAGKVHQLLFDAADLPRHADLVTTAIEALGGLDAALLAHGLLPDQRCCEEHSEETMKALTINGLSVVWLLMDLARHFERQRHGCLAVISSGAGDRGRHSTYVYGMAKAALTVCLQGLRQRLFQAGVSVVTIKPAFVDTPMTAYLPRPLRFVSAHAAGMRIYRAMRRGEDVVYIPWWWRWVLGIIRSIPEGLFKRLDFEYQALQRRHPDVQEGIRPSVHTSDSVGQRV